MNTTGRVTLAEAPQPVVLSARWTRLKLSAEDPANPARRKPPPRRQRPTLLTNPTTHDDTPDPDSEEAQYALLIALGKAIADEDAATYARNNPTK